MNDTKEEVKHPQAEAREMLIALSQEVYDLVEAGTFPTVNDALMETMYKDGPHREFKNYAQWRREGFNVKEGEKPFLLWGRPKDIEQAVGSDEGGKFFPLAFLFSNAQVEPHEEPERAEIQPEPKAVLEPLPYG